MQITYFFKNFEDDEKGQLRNYVDTKTQRLEKIQQRIKADDPQLKITAERYEKKSAYNIGLTLTTPTDVYRASEDDHTIQEAIDLALDKLARQIMN